MEGVIGLGRDFKLFTSTRSSDQSQPHDPDDLAQTVFSQRKEAGMTKCTPLQISQVYRLCAPVAEFVEVKAPGLYLYATLLSPDPQSLRLALKNGTSLADPKDSWITHVVSTAEIVPPEK